MQPISEEMLERLVALKGSKALKEQWPRYSVARDRCLLHAGLLEVAGDWEPFRAVEDYSLIVVDGPVKVGRMLDMVPHPEGDYTGCLLVLGDVTCRDFANYYGGLVVVDGDFDVAGVAVNAFEDSGLVVTKDVRICHFHGYDIWVEFGGRFAVEYGNGYGLPIGWENHRPPSAVFPRHGKESSSANFGFKPDADGYIDAEDLVRSLKSRP